VSDRTTLLFALPGYRVLDVSLEHDGGRRVLVESVAEQGGCPACGLLSRRIRDRPTSRIKDLPHGPVPLRVWVRKRRFVCAEALCARKSFTETSAQLPARARLTARLRVKIRQAVSTTNRAMSEVGKDYGVAWWTVHRVLVAVAADALEPATPTSTIGIDETRARSVRWFLAEVGWRRTDPWMTSIVDLDPASRGGIIGLAPGRSGACVQGWMSLQSNEFRAAVQVVAIDPSAPYASGIRRALPHARIVLDHFHLVMLATAGDTLSPKAMTRLKTVLASDDRTGELGAAWAVKDLLRQLLQAHGPTRYSRHETAHRLTRFVTACAIADTVETTRLAATRLPQLVGT
jgi:transposase